MIAGGGNDGNLAGLSRFPYMTMDRAVLEFLPFWIAVARVGKLRHVAAMRADHIAQVKVKYDPDSRVVLGFRRTYSYPSDTKGRHCLSTNLHWD